MKQLKLFSDYAMQQCRKKPTTELKYHYNYEPIIRTVIDEHGIFLQSLRDEYLKYKKSPIDSQYGNKEYVVSMNWHTRILFTRYNDYLDYSYNYYHKILSICKNAKSKGELGDIRGKAHLRKHISKYNSIDDEFNRMYWVVQDGIYYYLSKMNPQMHEINLMFIDFFKKRHKQDNFYQPQKEVYDYHSTPSCPQFKYLLLGYDEKYLDEIEFSPIFTMFLYPITLTNYGKDNILEVLNYLGIKLQEYADKNGVSLLRYHFQRYIVRNLDRMKKLKNEIQLLSREAENELRVNKDLPKIGEGWIEETRLYYLIKEDFPNLLVIQHGRLAFLGRQNYDIWIPKLKIAIEYQGEQHYMPVDYFGGYEAYIATVERDERKRFLSIENGIKLFYVQKGYQYSEIRDEIKTSQNRAKLLTKREYLPKMTYGR
jgi:hypothetical protein